MGSITPVKYIFHLYHQIYIQNDCPDSWHRNFRFLWPIGTGTVYLYSRMVSSVMIVLVQYYSETLSPGASVTGSIIPERLVVRPEIHVWKLIRTTTSVFRMRP